MRRGWPRGWGTGSSCVFRQSAAAPGRAPPASPAQRAMSRADHPSRRHTTAKPSVASQRSPNARASASRRRASLRTRFASRRSCASMISRSTGPYFASHADSSHDALVLASADIGSAPALAAAFDMAAAFDATAALGATLAGALALDAALARVLALDVFLVAPALAGHSPELPAFRCMADMVSRPRREGKRKMRLR